MTLEESLFEDENLSIAKAQIETVAQAIAAFETIGMPARNLSARTRAEYSKDLDGLREFLEKRGVTRIGSVYLAHLEAFQAEMDVRGLSPATRRRKSIAVKVLFSFLVREQILPSDAAARLILPRRPQKEARFLSDREYRELLRVCSHNARDAALVELFLQTGMRLAEAAGLRVSDLELPGRVTPDPDNVGYARVTRKGGKVTTIPLNYKACKALKAYLVGRTPSAHDSLWVSKFGSPMSKRAIQAMIAKYLAEAGVQGASVHSLRHTMATHHVARGTDLKTLQETLGHADLATTSVYVSLAKKTQRKALQDHAL